MFHAQFSWNKKKRVKTETEKDGCKDTQTPNKSVLDVFPIYKVRAHTTI